MSNTPSGSIRLPTPEELDTAEMLTPADGITPIEKAPREDNTVLSYAELRERLEFQKEQRKLALKAHRSASAGAKITTRMLGGQST